MLTHLLTVEAGAHFANKDRKLEGSCHLLCFVARSQHPAKRLLQHVPQPAAALHTLIPALQRFTEFTSVGQPNMRQPVLSDIVLMVSEPKIEQGTCMKSIHSALCCPMALDMSVEQTSSQEGQCLPFKQIASFCNQSSSTLNVKSTHAFPRNLTTIRPFPKACIWKS